MRKTIYTLCVKLEELTTQYLTLHGTNIEEALKVKKKIQKLQKEIQELS
jgi:hypothetical protein